MDKIVLYSVLLNTCFDIIIAFTLKQTKERLDYIEDRINTESNFRREEFNALFDKVERMELMLNKLLEKKETESSVSEMSDKTVSDISSHKMMTIILKSFKTEKFENKRFKREILQDVNKQAELTKEANERVENSLEFITKKIGQLEQQTLQHDIDADKSAGQVIQRLEENAKNTTSLLYSSMQNTINKQAEQTKEANDRVENSLDFISKKIEQLKQQTLQHGIDSDKISGQRIQKLEENIKSATSILNSTMQKTVSKQCDLMKEACERVKNSLDFITKEIWLLKNETSKHDIDSANIAEQVIRNIDENTKHTTSTLNRTVQNAVKKQNEKTKEAYDRVENSIEYIAREIGQLKKETSQHDVDSSKLVGKLIHKLEENTKTTTSLLNSTLQKTETILVDLNGTGELIKDQIHLYEIMQSQLEDGKYACLNETHGLTKTSEVILKELRKYRSCFDLYQYGFRLDGIYQLQTGFAKTNVSVFCDMTTDGGGWTVFQRRQDGSEDFYRDWNDYKYGFGKVDGEFWLGNEYINLLTDDGKIHELRIDLEDYEGDQAYAKYNEFKIGPGSTNYTLEVSGYTGNAGDSLNDQDSSWRNHNGMQFSTKDRDNDLWSSNCASVYNGAWWFNSCFRSHLNGIYIKQKKCTSWTPCIVWGEWEGNYHNMKFTEMKLR